MWCWDRGEEAVSKGRGIASATSNSSLVDMHPPRQGNTICCCLKTPSAEHSMYGLQGYKLPPHVATSLQGSSIKHLYSLSNFPQKHESNSLFYDNITKLKLNLLSLMNCTVHECWLNYVFFILFFSSISSWMFDTF